jgi:WD40 repeat protein
MSAGAPPPFKGLAPFQDTDEDVAFFFGREREQELIEANLMASRLTVVYGEAGVGKSSVLRAGLAHHLRTTAAANLEARGEPGLAVVVFDDWRDDPVQGLRAAVADAVTRALGGTVRPEDEGRSLTDTFGLWQELLGGDLYVVLDQLEQYFLYHGAESGPGTFHDELAAVVGSVELRVNFLLAIREDALAKLDAFRRLIPGVLENYLRIEHLDRDAARAAILEPVAAWNRLAGEAAAVAIEPGLVEAVLEQVAAGKVDLGLAGRGAVTGATGDGRIETPYLQLVMRRLWDEERETGSATLRLETLARLGGAQQIVRDHVELALGGLTTAEKDVAARLFDHLVTPSGTKIAHESRDLAEYAGTTEAGVLPVLTKLGEERILRSTAGSDVSGARYEIFHDVLAEPVLAWKARHEQARALERANELARRKHRRLAFLAAGALLALVILAGLTVFAFTQQSRAQAHERKAKSRALAAGALTQLGVDPELSLLLALDAATVQDTPSVDSVLRTALVASRVRRVAVLGSPVLDLVAVPGGVVAATKSSLILLDDRLRPLHRSRPPGRFVNAGGDDAVYQTARGLELRRLEDGSLEHVVPLPSAGRVDVATVDSAGELVALGEGGNRVDVLDAATGRPRLVLVQSSRVTALAFDPTARVLASGGRDGTVRVWHLGGRRAPRVLRGHVGAVRDVVLSPHGSLLASGSSDGTARVYRLSDGGSVAVMSGHTNPITQVGFSPDGTRIVTASLDGTARVWKVETGAELALLPGHRGPVTAAAFTDDSSVATGGDDGTVRLWYVLVEPELRLLAQLPGPVERASFRAADRVEAVTPDGRAHVFDLSGKLLGVHPAAPEPPARSALGAVATRTGNTVRIREPDGSVVVLRGHTGPVTSVRFSPDGSLAATASRDATARIWDARTGAPLHVLRGHFGTVNDASFSPDGQWVVTAGPSTAALWSAGTGERLFYLRGHQGPVTSASFDPGGTTILTSGVDGTIRTYDCDICRSGPALAAVARRRLAATGRTLSPAEQKAFGS